MENTWNLNQGFKIEPQHILYLLFNLFSSYCVLRDIFQFLQGLGTIKSSYGQICHESKAKISKTDGTRFR